MIRSRDVSYHIGSRCPYQAKRRPSNPLCVLVVHPRFRTVEAEVLLGMDSATLESIPNMSGRAAKYARWVVRVVEPELVEYQFKGRLETVFAKKFMCRLVSKDPKQYVEAIVPFSFVKKDGPAVLCAQCVENDCHLLPLCIVPTPCADVRFCCIADVFYRADAVC